ncbi:Oxidoreductase, FAD-binding protein [Roseibacterium elongatum DSM 19469]|uniref:Oxidoreductase, FAD-binding protein n=1 Tax=Roseicyclus elongatus DSM 19469 TaxID=1294273 RepID=W8SJY9_9RHOB|nr:FAD-dependent oxidoreductase [Roseibacterium elongatum]AHM02825.1 Oxidoreductase, FAD-binding protein [Roseibacterium elongatum DSM 19469]
MDYDFVIIGGGIAGTSAGARLSELGRVLVLEAEPALAYHASGRSAALFEENYGHPVTVALNRASRTEHEQIDGGLLSPRGLMVLAGPGDEGRFPDDVATMELEEIDLDAACDLVPILNRDHVRRAAWHDAAWDIDTDRMVQVFARQIRAHGGSVQTNARVTQIARQKKLWHVSVGDETHAGATIVNAAGAWADRIATMAGIAPIGLRPLRRSMARMPAPGGHDVSRWPMLIGVGETWYAKPDAGAWLVSPAEEDPVTEPHDAWADDMVLAEGIARYQPFVTEEVTRLTASWAGLRSFAPDRCLVIGPEPGRRDFLWFAGQGGYGFQTAPAASRLLADLVAGRMPELGPELVAALSPARLRPVGNPRA